MRSLQEEYLSNKHCIEVSSQYAKVFLIVDLEDYTDFFNFLFDSGFEVSLVDLEKYLRYCRIQPKFSNDILKTKEFCSKAKIPICLHINKDVSYEDSLNFYLNP